MPLAPEAFFAKSVPRDGGQGGQAGLAGDFAVVLVRYSGPRWFSSVLVRRREWASGVGDTFAQTRQTSGALVVGVKKRLLYNIERGFSCREGELCNNERVEERE